MNIFANSWLHNTTSFLHVLKKVFVVVVVEFLSSFVSSQRRKEKQKRIKRNVRRKFSCPISWNMFTEGILICTRKRKNDVFKHFLHTPTHTLLHTHSHIEHVIFVFIHSMLLHNYIIFHVPFSPFFFCPLRVSVCGALFTSASVDFRINECVRNVFRCTRVHMCVRRGK